MVIPVRPGDHNPSLVLALRSIAQNFPYRKVWVAGHFPRFLSPDHVGHIPVAQPMSHWRNVLMIMDHVADHAEVSETFNFFNDDFYVLKKVPGAPIIHEGTLEERAKRLKGLSLGEYSRGATETLTVLRNAGYDNPWNFDLHIPLPMDKASVEKALTILPAPYTFWPHFRSIVGAVAGYEGISGSDMKFTGVATRIPAGAEFVSTSVRSLGAGQVGRQLRQLFPKTSVFEKAHYL